jgi:hypothetical protein
MWVDLQFNGPPRMNPKVSGLHDALVDVYEKHGKARTFRDGIRLLVLNPLNPDLYAGAADALYVVGTGADPHTD